MSIFREGIREGKIFVTASAVWAQGPRGTSGSYGQKLKAKTKANGFNTEGTEFEPEGTEKPISGCD
jgi:hypothetical protein